MLISNDNKKILPDKKIKSGKTILKAFKQYKFRNNLFASNLTREALTMETKKILFDLMNAAANYFDPKFCFSALKCNDPLYEIDESDVELVLASKAFRNNYEDMFLK